MNNDLLQIEYTPIEVYKFAAAGDIDNLRKALIHERNFTNWYETSDVEEEEEDLVVANALAAASFYDKTECISILLDKGIDIESVNAHGDTALTIAAYNGNFQSLKLLIERGANIETFSGSLTPCESASGQGNTDCLQLLIDNGANLNFRSRYGYTAWHIAAEQQRLDCMKVLLNAGIDINSSLDDGQTALHQCIQEQYIECVRFLLQKGACLNKREKKFNLTPVDFALRYQKTLVLGVLAEAIETNTRKVFLKKFISSHINYKPSYEKCINSLFQYTVDAPPVVLNQVEAIITNSYFNEIFFDIHLHIAATSFKQRTSKATSYPPLNNSPVLSSECRDGLASNSNDTSTLMVVLSSYLKEYLKPNFNLHCFNCGRRPNSTFRCSACKRITYCQRSCQREDWKLHKYNCC